MGRGGLWHKLLWGALTGLLLPVASSFSQARIQILELLKDRDVREIYSAVASENGKILARMGSMVTPSGVERVLWLFVKTKGMDYRIYYFTSAENHKILVIFLDSSVNDHALRELIR